MVQVYCAASRANAAALTSADAGSEHGPPGLYDPPRVLTYAKFYPVSTGLMHDGILGVSGHVVACAVCAGGG